MELVREKRNISNLTRYYRDENPVDANVIIQWISDVRKINDVSISYILLNDLVNRSDEGSDNLQLPGDANIEVIENAINHRNIDVISAYGTFKGMPVVIGANINRCEKFITVRRNNKADIDALEREINIICYSGDTAY